MRTYRSPGMWPWRSSRMWTVGIVLPFAPVSPFGLVASVDGVADVSAGEVDPLPSLPCSGAVMICYSHLGSSPTDESQSEYRRWNWQRNARTLPIVPRLSSIGDDVRSTFT